ncbi:hemagglutinin repeat-containing protein [Fusobacterium nucleatum]|uniref:two-partner secretion domain-containing protein n=1 Tax=Fusobacterium nucleatum TaxID=851 RepID=UPI0030D49128
MTDKKSLDFKRYFRNRIRRIEAFIMLILFSFNIFAEIVPDPASIGARATKTASGIDQLDITAPNKNGTSYNSLKELQVSEQGLILNNNKDIVVNTKTAGYVTRNRNLDNSIAASLIITEVTGKNKTNINGTVEVAGKRADLVMANRNGIYVNGGNFLNTDRVTLTTGSLEMKNGDLVAINVSQGQIGIGRNGIDALNLTDLELLGKTIDVSGVIKASKETRLLVSAGGQTYEYKTKEVKSKGESYKGIAIDGKAVGSMYAGKIDIISNDKGAGVNTKGDLVSVDDIVLTANGDITTAKVDSGKDLKYETTQKVKMNGKTTIAKKVKVKAKETEINAKVITGYLEKALGKKSLSIESEKTKITSKIEAYGKVEIKSDYTQNNGEISANEKINIVGNKLNNNNGEIRSQEKIAINTKETSNVKGYILSDGLTKEDVKKEENKNQKNIEDDKNKEKGIEITGNLDNREGIIRGREVSLGNLTGNNKGKIDSIGALTFNGKTIVNKGGVISGNIQELNVDRLINDEGKLLSTEKINGTAKEISNKNGEILGTQTVKLIGDKLNNLSGLIKSNGKIVLGMKETSNVKGYILSDGLTKEDVKKEENKNQKDVKDDKNKEKGIEITGNLDNREGVIRGKEVTVGGNLTGNNKGKIDSIGALTFNGKTIVNKGGLISGNIQELNVDRLINDEGKLLSTEKISGTAKKTSNVNGEVTGTQTVKLIGDKLNNLLGLIKSNGKITLDMKETSNVKGYILSDGLTKEDVKKEENKNQKDVKEDKNKEKGIEITGDLDNTEGVIRGREISLGNLTGNNKGKIDSIGALTFNGKTIVNKGGLISGNIQELNVDKLINDEGKLLSTEKISGTAKETSNKNGEISGTQTVKLIGDKLNNLSGVIRSYGKIKLNEKDVSNVEGYILSDGITKEQAQNWKVEEKAVEESKEDKKDVKEKQEKKEQTTGTLLNIGRLDNAKGIIASLSQTTVNVGKITNNDGKIVSKGAVELTTPNEYEYEYKGLVEGDYSTKLNAKKIIINTNIDRKNTLSLISKEELTLGQNIRARILSIATQADLRNTKDISATNLLSITAKNIENSGNLYSNGNTYLEAKNGDLINKDGGSIKADKQVYIKVENGRVVNGTAKYLDGAYRREDGVLVDNRQTSKEKPSIIAGKTETIIKAKDFINTSLIGKAGQGITYIELAGKGVNASIGDNIAKIEGQKVSVEGNKGVTNIGAVISGTEITRVTSKNGKVLNESTITTEELTRTVEKKKKFLRKKYTEVYGTIERIRNIGKIEGNGIIYVEGKEIENVAGNIGGAGGTLLKSTLGNIEDKTITLIDNRRDVTETYTEMREVRPKGKWWRRREAENPEPKKYEQVQVYKYWDIVNKTKTVSGVIGNGKDTILDSAKDLVLESSDIRAKDNIALNAKNHILMLSTVGTEYKFRTETSSKRSWGRKKTKTETWIEDNIYANPVELTSGGYILINYREKGKPADNKGIFAQGVNFNAKKGIIAKSDGNIYIQGIKDKLNSTYDSHTTKSFIGIKYKRTSDYVSDNREKYKHSQLYGESGVTLDSQGRLRVQGIDIQTIGPVYLKGVKGVEILSGNEVSSRYEEHTSKNFKIGSDKVLKIEQNKNTKEIDIIKSIGSIINSKGSMVTIEGDKVVSIGSKIGAAGDINLIGKNGVIIKDGENFAKIKEETEKMRTNLFASWSLKNLSASAGVEAVYNKTNDGKTMGTPEKNIFITNKNLNITSTSGNIFMQGDFGAKEDINVKAEKGKIYIKDSKSEVLTDSKSVNARMALAFGINLSGFKDTLKSYKSQLKAVKEIGNLGRVISFTRDMAKGKSLLESLDGKEDTINAISTMYNGPSTGSASAGLDVTGSINVSKSTSKYLQNITTNIRAGKDIVFKSKEFETEGSFIRAENNLSIDASKILIQASADKYATNSKNMGANFGITLIGSNGVSAGLNYGQMKSKGTLYNNAQIQAGNKLIVKADDMTVRGGRLEGKYVDVDVKKNLLIESLQDSEKMKQIGANLGYSFKKEKAQDGTVSKKGDGSLGLSFGGKDKKWVKEQSGIIGTENAKVSVGGTTKLIGSIIGGKNTTLRTGKLEYSDIYDKDKGYDIGLNSKVTVSKNEDEWNISKTIGANFGAKDKEQINRATIGSGTIIVGGKVVNPNINRDESIAQEITKNVNVDGISVEYKDNRRRWSDISDIMGEYGKSLGSDLDKMSGGKYNLENKLSNGISNFVFEVEKVLDHHLGNKYIGLIPTKEYRGGIIGQFQEFKTRYFDGTQKLYITETKIMKDEKGHTMFDKDGVPLLSTKTRELKPGETVGKDVRKVVTLNGVFNNKMEAIAGGLASTITADENKALLAGKTIKSVVIHNESGGLVVDATETIVTKLGGLLGNRNWGAKKLEGMFKDNPWIMEKMNWHSQGSIYGAAAMIHFLDTEEGKAIAEKNLGTVGIKGIAITALGYGKLDRRMKALGTGAQLYYMRNIGDWVSFIAAQGMKRNTDGYGHDNIGYNDEHYKLNIDSGIYERKKITIIRDGKEEEIAVPNYEYKIGEMDGKDMRSIFERIADKRAQEKWYGGK